MNFRKWTPDEDVILINLYEAGKSWAHIGRILGVGYNACQYRYQRHLNPESRYVKKRKIVREEPETIVLKYNPKADAGLTYRYEDDPRADKRSPVGWSNGVPVWLERRSQARGEYDWGLNPVMPGR